MARQTRHSTRQLLWRALLAAASNTVMTSGLYPMLPHLGMMLDPSSRQSQLSPGAQLRSVAAEWAAAVAMSAARPVGFLDMSGAPWQVQGPRPIIGVHGYAMNRSCFWPLALHLRRAGLGPLLGFEYWTLGSVASAARRLGAYIEEVCAHTGHERVDIIGHSMGGVVGRYYTALRQGSPRVRHLITIGSPHRGSELSHMGIGRPHKELLAGSNLMQRLAHAPTPPETRMTVIWSRSDALVWGERQARIGAGAHASPDRDDNVSEVIFDDLGHVSMLYSPRVARVVIDLLRS